MFGYQIHSNYEGILKGRRRFTAILHAVEKKRSDFGRIHTGKLRSLGLLSAWKPLLAQVSIALCCSPWGSERGSISMPC